MGNGKRVNRANDIPYSMDGLRRAIRAAEVNIVTFKDAIEKEYVNIGQFKFMLNTLEKKQLEESEDGD